MGDETAPQHEYARQTSDPKQMGQEDVMLDVPTLHADSVDLELSDLRARVSLNAEVLSLLRLSVGVDVNLGQARLDLRGIDAQALLKVRLENVVSIIGRVLQTIDSHPEIIEPMLRSIQETLRQTGYSVGPAQGRIGGRTAGVGDVSGERAARVTQQAGQQETSQATQGVQEARRGAAPAGREAGQGAPQEAGQATDRESARPDIEARAAVNAERVRRAANGEGSRNGKRKRTDWGPPRRIRRR